jgi:hypothetical protein
LFKLAHSNIQPRDIIDRKKEALKNPEIKEDKLKYRQKAIDLFLDAIR